MGKVKGFILDICEFNASKLKFFDSKVLKAVVFRKKIFEKVALQ